ncbi:hypothetical protein [Borrelia puertoricensis]|uniref:hypothetical protein n=1 Tax=Borrelia puertoricensis TaxID=2756107 RepID=UPI001FF1333D|nr:hypothetical protein [Borrelia puertoricensis]UPA18462.1 hypothetical protein bpuSUM_000961 [Borrelia puertoricensis]UPA18771.1 hypothetical protein bpuSUM_001340 [Borrelia puertoricensis]UPA18807.1 hypothetical protein bpuSUM_001296 [Borrelia puertoricensis]
MDLKVDLQFNLVSGSDLQIADGIEEQKQRLFIFLKTPKGSLALNPTWGFDYTHILKLCKLGTLDQIKYYLYSVAQELDIDLTGVNININSKILQITLYFPGDSFQTEICI